MNIEKNILKIREDFPITHYRKFMDTAAVGALSRPAANAINEYVESHLHYPKLSVMEQHLEWDSHMDLAKKEASTLMKCSTDELTHITSTSYGISTVASMIDWKSGDNIVVNDLEFPANVIPWVRLQKHGVETKCVKSKNGRISLESMEKAMDERTRLIAVSWVQWTTGFRLNLAALTKLAEEKNAYLCVDGVQGVGALDINLRNSKIHFMATSAHKWLCAPFCAGLFYCRKDLIEDFEPVIVGARQMTRPPLGLKAYESEDFDPIEYSNKGLKLTADRFASPGSPNAAGIYGLNAALKYLNDIGISNIEKRVLALTRRLADGLLKIGVKISSPIEIETERSGILSFRAKPQFYEKVLASNIVVSVRYSAGQGGIRVSPHFFNSDEEIDALLSVVKQEYH